MKFLVIIPTYKEVFNLQTLVPEILSVYSNSHVLVIDDYSDDLTENLMGIFETQHSGRVYFICRRSNPSYAESLVEGFQFAAAHEYEKLVQMDADGSHSVGDIKLLLEADANMSIGSRYKLKSKVINVPIARQVFSIFGNVYISLLWRTLLRDKTNGFRCYDRETILKLSNFKNSSQGFAIQIEVLYHLLSNKTVRIYEVPITFNFRKIGESKFDFAKLLEAFSLATSLFLHKRKHHN